ncbi:hypothetical protein GW17_00002188 [Ensete ventricosum]|nr:hypothetical protein GW17_00002188 [Ensete ventricosum]
MALPSTRQLLLLLVALSFVFFFLSLMCYPKPFMAISRGDLLGLRPVNETTISKNCCLATYMDYNCSTLTECRFFFFFFFYFCFADGDAADCDLADGAWVRDLDGSGYTNGSCPLMLEHNCGKYGKDQGYVNWRWKPKQCQLPRFQGKVEIPLGAKDEDEDTVKTWYFQSYDFTLMQLWTKFLVEAAEQVINGTGTGFYDLHLDRIDTSWSGKLPLLDYLVISDGHWFFRKLYLHEYDKLVGCVYCSEGNLTDFGINFAIRKAFRTAFQFINECEQCEGLVTVVRTFAPAHFENGTWNDGGDCSRTRPFEESAISLTGTEYDIRSTQVEELESMRSAKGGKGFGLLDVTKAMMMRPDAHPGSHRDFMGMKGFNDCVHWCLPGPVDMWNEMLLAVLKKEGLIAT